LERGKLTALIKKMVRKRKDTLGEKLAMKAGIAVEKRVAR